MHFENRKAIFASRKRRMFVTIGFVIVVILVTPIGFLDINVLKAGHFFFTIAACIIYALINIWFAQLKLNYIYFSDEGQKIVLRYFSLSIISKEKRAIEIPKKEFSGYEILHSFFNKRMEIILLQKRKTGIAKYPPVSITALKKAEQDALFRQLDRLAGKG
ncbi:MAG: hypothetical protein KJ607_14975 [Bacteroidetes bacterium]|nr:hypothetical protein [Bacteroidota bacterium]